MIPIVIYNSWIMKKLNEFHHRRYLKERDKNPKETKMPFRGYAAMTIYPFILVDGPDIDNETFRHETIHIKQYTETLIIGFLLIYAWDYFYSRFWKRMSHDKAYENIRFEKEAYQNARDPLYLRDRKHFAWTKFPLKRTDDAEDTDSR